MTRWKPDDRVTLTPMGAAALDWEDPDYLDWLVEYQRRSLAVYLDMRPWLWRVRDARPASA